MCIGELHEFRHNEKGEATRTLYACASETLPHVQHYASMLLCKAKDHIDSKA
jgi:hypothetical protein